MLGSTPSWILCQRAMGSFLSHFDKFLVNILLATLQKSLRIVESSSSRFVGSKPNGAFKYYFNRQEISFVQLQSNPLMSHFKHTHFTLSETIGNSKIDLPRASLSFRGNLPTPSIKLLKFARLSSQLKLI